MSKKKSGRLYGHYCKICGEYKAKEKFLPERLGGHQVYHLQDRDICPRVDNTTGRVLAVNRIKICLYLRFYRIVFLDKTRI